MKEVTAQLQLEKATAFYEHPGWRQTVKRSGRPEQYIAIALRHSSMAAALLDADATD